MDEVDGQPLAFLFGVGEEDAERTRELLSRAARGEPASFQRWARRRGGGSFWVDGSISPLKSGTGDLEGFAVVMRDATQLKREDEALRGSQAMFEGILAIPTDGVVCIDFSFTIPVHDGRRGPD